MYGWLPGPLCCGVRDGGAYVWAGTVPCSWEWRRFRDRLSGAGTGSNIAVLGGGPVEEYDGHLVPVRGGVVVFATLSGGGTAARAYGVDRFIGWRRRDVVGSTCLCCGWVAPALVTALGLRCLRCAVPHRGPGSMRSAPTRTLAPPVTIAWRRGPEDGHVKLDRIEAVAAREPGNA